MATQHLVRTSILGAALIVASVFAIPRSAYASGLSCSAVISGQSAGQPGAHRINIFAAQAHASVSQLRLQRVALDVLKGFSGDALDAELSARASEKLVYFQGEHGAEELRHQLATQASSGDFGRDALEYILMTFNGHGDQGLRLAAIRELARHSHADEASIEILLPLARGATNFAYDDLREAANAIQKIGQRTSGEVYFTARNDHSAHSASEHQLLTNLKHASVESIGPLSAGAHAHATLLVTFRLADGSRLRGVFKPRLGEGSIENRDLNYALFTREIQAFDLYNEVFGRHGLFVPTTLELVLRHQGESYGVGSLQLFVSGFETANSFYTHGHPYGYWPEFHLIWEKQRADHRWSELEPWIRAFDWIIGNTDRFPNSRYNSGSPNNLMMRETQGAGSAIEVALIDNGDGRIPHAHGAYGEYDAPKQLPNDLRTLLSNLSDERIAQIRARFAKDLPPEGLNDLEWRLRYMRHVASGH